ncbi:MAG: family 78 glycoside hydrolase catalytic domain [Verrucomicrobiota bacterium]
MNSSLFSSAPCWIWSDAATRPHHNIVLFRRVFDVAGDAPSARLLITADSRYEVFLNGEWLGFGPARSWPSPWPVDPYDLSGFLRTGRNVLSVRVQHFGVGTFQYLHAEAGLLAQLAWSDDRGEHLLATDSTWRAHADVGFLWPVPRLSCQQAWEEQFDARLSPAGWTQPDFDDSAWSGALAGLNAGKGIHAEFAPRPIPQLTRESVSPVSLRAIEAVSSAPYQWNLNPRAFLNHVDLTANYLRGRLLLLTHIFSDRAQKLSLHPPHDRPAPAWTLNGRAVEFSDHTLQQTDTGVGHVRLKAGWNTLMGALPESEHYWWMVLNAWTEHPVRWSAWPDERAAPTPWLALGPFGDVSAPPPPPEGIHRVMVDAERLPAGVTPELFDELRRRGSLDPIHFDAAWVRPLTRDMIADSDIYARCSSERVLEKQIPRVDASHALLHDTADWTVIHPAIGADVRLLLDFGREVVGFHEFEVDAPAGTIIDNHNFEFIQPDGRHNLAEGMNNSFRYVCREGRQRFRTLLRRGFRYSWFSFRAFDRPVRVRFIRVLMSTYPQARKGAFTCSDPALDRIWETGAHSVRCCSEDTYTDCPSYEQTLWVGDARNEALVDFMVNGDARLSAYSWDLAAKSLDRSPLVESQVPSAWENLLPAWSFLWMRWAQEHHQFSGDDKFGRRMLRDLARNIAGIEAHLSPRGLFRIKAWNMFDWAELDTPPDGEITHLNALAVLGLRQAATLAENLGAAKEARAWSALAARITRAINRHLWDEKRRAYIDCIRPDGVRSPVFSQQTHTAVYIAGVATGERLQRSRAIMERAPKGFVQAGSPFFMFFVLEGLAREKRFADLVRTIRDYWGRQTEAGATTFWETYHPHATRMTRSHCHGWSAAPTYFLSHYILGVQPAKPGFRAVLIAPRPAGLSWARGGVPTPDGAVEVSWSHDRKTGRFELRIILPAGLPAEIELPFPGRVIDLEGGTVRRASRAGSPRRIRSTGGVIKLKLEITAA